METNFNVLWETSENGLTHPSDRTETPPEPRSDSHPIRIYPSPQNALQSTSDPSERDQLYLQAYRIITDYKQKRAAAEGIMRQIEKDIGTKDPLTLLLLAAEALDRMSGGGDMYIKRLQAKL